MLYDYNVVWDPRSAMSSILCIWYVNENLLSHARSLFGKDEYDESVYEREGGKG